MTTATSNIPTEYDALVRLHATRRVLLNQLDEIRQLLEDDLMRATEIMAGYMGAAQLYDESDARSPRLEEHIETHVRFLVGEIDEATLRRETGLGHDA